MAKTKKTWRVGDLVKINGSKLKTFGRITDVGWMNGKNHFHDHAWVSVRCINGQVYNDIWPPLVEEPNLLERLAFESRV